MVGLVACNMMLRGQPDDPKGLIVPRLNMSIPITSLIPVFRFARNNTPGGKPTTTTPSFSLFSFSERARPD